MSQLWDAGLTEEAGRLAAFGDVGCRAAGHGERLGRDDFPPWLDQLLGIPSSLFWVLEKGIWVLSEIHSIVC